MSTLLGGRTLPGAISTGWLARVGARLWSGDAPHSEPRAHPPGTLTGSISMVPGGPGSPSAPGRPGRPGGPCGQRAGERVRAQEGAGLGCREGAEVGPAGSHGESAERRRAQSPEEGPSLRAEDEETPDPGEPIEEAESLEPAVQSGRGHPMGGGHGRGIVASTALGASLPGDP